jgi:hypothetical protein
VPDLVDRGAGHPDRCWLATDQKRAKRELAPGEIGLAIKPGVDTADQGAGTAQAAEVGDA